MWTVKSALFVLTPRVKGLILFSCFQCGASVRPALHPSDTVQYLARSWLCVFWGVMQLIWLSIYSAGA